MADGLSPVSKADIPAIVEAKPFSLGLIERAVLMALIIVGILGFATELASGSSRHAWMSLHVNFLYWFALAAAASGFSAVFHICNAQWARPIIRIFQSATPFMSWSPVLLIVLYFGHSQLFIWAHEPIPGKGVWLTSNFLFARDFLAICLLGALIRKVQFLTLRRDIGAVRFGMTGLPDSKVSRWTDKRYNKFVAGWGQNAYDELETVHEKLSRLSPIVVVTYALVMSLIAFDQIMSVDPYWYSTLFGGFYFMTAVYLCMAWVSIMVGFARKHHPLFLVKIERRTLHDLGKLLFGFGIFWAYLFWSHYLTIWYGNMPEETTYIILRLRKEPWHSVAWMVLGCSFIIPFLLGLSRDVKQVPALLLATGTIAAIGMWILMYLLFAPTLYPDTLPFSITDVLVGLGYMGAFLLSAALYLEKYPVIPFGDLYRVPGGSAALEHDLAVHC